MSIILFILLCSYQSLAQDNNSLYEVHLMDDENQSYILESTYGNNTQFILRVNDSLSNYECQTSIIDINLKNISINNTDIYYYISVQCPERSAVYMRLGIDLSEGQMANSSLYLGNHTQKMDCIESALRSWLADFINNYLNHPYCRSNIVFSPRSNENEYYYSPRRSSNNPNVWGIVIASSGSLTLLWCSLYLIFRDRKQ